VQGGDIRGLEERGVPGVYLSEALQCWAQEDFACALILHYMVEKTPFVVTFLFLF